MVSVRVVVPIVVVVLAVVGVFLLAGDTGRTGTTTPATTTPQRTETQTPTPTPTPTRTQAIVSLTLYMNDYGYNASRGGPTIKAFVGDLIRIRLIGNGSGPIVHDFVLDEKSPSPYNVRSERLSRGREQTIEFIANHAGVFKYYCSVAPPAGLSHRDRGQEGTIEILPR
ncbi:MAG: hypothetical protein N3H84_05170 [Candidatus Caldarchaeum sp.]|nr:hypothetical protein [Candidatus Caldarchaeum sp.]MCX8201477.1 hypothetical protein [Candidatus Caldarchaeum sp.]MDW8434588.1 hypothetical protein [Candidatus Caldarchaeum sp.]